MNKIKISEDELYVAYAQKLIKHAFFKECNILEQYEKTYTIVFLEGCNVYTILKQNSNN